MPVDLHNLQEILKKNVGVLMIQYFLYNIRSYPVSYAVVIGSYPVDFFQNQFLSIKFQYFVIQILDLSCLLLMKIE